MPDPPDLRAAPGEEERQVRPTASIVAVEKVVEVGRPLD